MKFLSVFMAFCLLGFSVPAQNKLLANDIESKRNLEDLQTPLEW